MGDVKSVMGCILASCTGSSASNVAHSGFTSVGILDVSCTLGVKMQHSHISLITLEQR